MASLINSVQSAAIVTLILAGISQAGDPVALNPQSEPPGRGLNGIQRFGFNPQIGHSGNPVALNPQSEPPGRRYVPTTRIRPFNQNVRTWQQNPPQSTQSQSIIIQHQVRSVQSQQEQVRNNRQMAVTAFQNFDQKSNQRYNMLRNIMQAQNEMRMGTIRNMR